ncbi:MAG TPA: hypothetical protein VEW48_20690 [Thermoanaerobaculia bacterium]|nr:hypothetical protein [Thermoanaerobaculia bacterium]
MTRRALLVPLFAAAFILAPSEIAGWAQAAPAEGTIKPPATVDGSFAVDWSRPREAVARGFSFG